MRGDEIAETVGTVLVFLYLALFLLSPFSRAFAVCLSDFCNSSYMVQPEKMDCNDKPNPSFKKPISLHFCWVFLGQRSWHEELSVTP